MDISNCKNCQFEITTKHKFCANCGAKIVTSRITLKSLFSDFTDKFLGWDNRYFNTIKALLIFPKKSLEAYLNGTRKQLVNPVTFFALGMTISIICFNFFHNEYLSLSGSEVNYELLENLSMPENYMAESSLSIEEKTKLFNQEITSAIWMMKIQESVLKYFNFYSFLMLPIYTLIGFLVYRKKYNYGEHLVINAYLQGILFLFTSLFFLLAVTLWDGFYAISFFLGIVYYMYVYSSLFEHGFGKILLHFLKFLIVLLALAILAALTSMAAVRLFF